ncbi:MAG: hypothetical protein JWN60_2191 [Acidobacteria bacterium]|jgi:hypothetical protein|nr:hypothetical protein [Acidobacteriota bacterium]
MYCPRCSRQQLSGETKYCSSCGFPLVVVSELLAHGGYLPQLESKKKGILPSRKTGMKIGLSWFLIGTLLLTSLFGVIGADKLAGFCAVLGTMGGILIMLFSWMFLEKSVSPQYQPSLPAADNHAAQQFVGAKAPQTALPQPSHPVESYIPPAQKWRAPNTGEFAGPESVTEGTTKLLTKDE